MVKDFFIRFLRALRTIIGPKGCCIYEFSCIDYAQMQLEDHYLSQAIFNITKRVLSCNIFYKLFKS